MAVRVDPLLALQAARALVSAASNSSTEGSRGSGAALVRRTLSEGREDLATSPLASLACRIGRMDLGLSKDLTYSRRAADPPHSRQTKDGESRFDPKSR